MNKIKTNYCMKWRTSMDYKETHISFLYDDLVKEYGNEQGKLLYALMCKKFANLCEKEMKSENHAINEHVFERLLPTISMYLTLIENDFTQEEALRIAHKEIQHHASNMAEENAKLKKMPFTYGLFKMFAKSHMKKKYPIEGFTVEWKRHDCKEVHFDIVCCIYKEMCEKYHCPELCTVFCQSDITAFAGYRPKIRFERSGTIGEGANCCDFHFIRGN